MGVDWRWSKRGGGGYKQNVDQSRDDDRQTRQSSNSPRLCSTSFLSLSSVATIGLGFDLQAVLSVDPGDVQVHLHHPLGRHGDGGVDLVLKPCSTGCKWIAPAVSWVIGKDQSPASDPPSFLTTQCKMMCLVCNSPQTLRRQRSLRIETTKLAPLPPATRTAT